MYQKEEAGEHIGTIHLQDIAVVYATESDRKFRIVCVKPFSISGNRYEVCCVKYWCHSRKISDALRRAIINQSVYHIPPPHYYFYVALIFAFYIFFYYFFPKFFPTALI